MEKHWKNIWNRKAEWHWQNGGIITLKAGENKIELQDLTGFDGRCDAVFLTSDMNMLLPDSGNELADFRRNMSEEPIIQRMEENTTWLLSVAE